MISIHVKKTLAVSHVDEEGYVLKGIVRKFTATFEQSDSKLLELTKENVGFIPVK